MFKVITILATLLSAAAFAPASKMASSSSSSSSSLTMAFKTAIGAQMPLGFFDPLGLLKDADQARFDRLRTVEVKHGRIAMLAVLGHIVTTAGVRLPGEIAFQVPYATMKTGLAAFDTIPQGGLVQIILFIGLLEMGFSQKKESIEQTCQDKYASFCVDRRKSVELNNGRAAQMGILGLMVHEKLDNNPYIVNALFGSPVPFN